VEPKARGAEGDEGVAASGAEGDEGAAARGAEGEEKGNGGGGWRGERAWRRDR
jgi:hypothetical protein